MKHFLLALTFSLLSTAVFAQTVPVRTGEHGGFTRLALDLPSGLAWDIVGEDQSLRVKLNDESLRFDYRQAFDRIDRSRISAIRTADRGVLEISIACDCAANAFVLGGQMLVIDVEPRVEGAPRVTASGNTPGLFAEQAPVIAALPLLPNTPRVRLVEQLGAPQIAFAPPLESPDQTAAAVSSPEEFSTASNAKDSELETADGRDPIANLETSSDIAPARAAETVGELRGAVRNSAFAGILDVAPEAVLEVAPTQTRPAQEPTDADTIVATTRRTETDAGFSLSVDVCVPDGLLIPAASEAPDFSDLVSTRAALFSELDTVRPDGLLAHRAALLALGFGAEARAVGQLLGDTQDAVAQALSYLVDGETDPARYFADQLECNGQAALWALLTRADDPAIPMVDPVQILAQVQALPPALRRHLGPRVATAMHRAGHTASAEDLLAQMARAQSAPPDDLALAGAGIALDSGSEDRAATLLNSVTLEDRSDRPALVLARVDTAFANGRPVAPDTLDVAELTYLERRETAQADLYWRGYIRALLSTGAFDAAVSVFEDVPASVRDDVFATTRRELAARLVTEAPDVTFLKHALGDGPGALAPRDQALGRAFAERLLDLGLPNAALAMIDRIDPNVTGTATETSITNRVAAADTVAALSVIRAKSLIGLGQYPQAEQALAGLAQAEAIALRAEIRERQGAFDAARADFEQIADATSAARAAWLGGAWSDVAAQDGVFGDAAALVVQPPPAIANADPAEPALAALQNLVEGSQNTRATLDALLGATAIDAF